MFKLNLLKLSLCAYLTFCQLNLYSFEGVQNVICDHIDHGPLDHTDPDGNGICGDQSIPPSEGGGSEPPTDTGPSYCVSHRTLEQTSLEKIGFRCLKTASSSCPNGTTDVGGEIPLGSYHGACRYGFTDLEAHPNWATMYTENSFKDQNVCVKNIAQNGSPLCSAPSIATENPMMIGTTDAKDYLKVCPTGSIFHPNATSIDPSFLTNNSLPVPNECRPDYCLISNGNCQAVPTNGRCPGGDSQNRFGTMASDINCTPPDPDPSEGGTISYCAGTPNCSPVGTLGCPSGTSLITLSDSAPMPAMDVCDYSSNEMVLCYTLDTNQTVDCSLQIAPNSRGLCQSPYKTAKLTTINRILSKLGLSTITNPADLASNTESFQRLCEYFLRYSKKPQANRNIETSLPVAP